MYGVFSSNQKFFFTKIVPYSIRFQTGVRFEEKLHIITEGFYSHFIKVINHWKTFRLVQLILIHNTV